MNTPAPVIPLYEPHIHQDDLHRWHMTIIITPRAGMEPLHTNPIILKSWQYFEALKEAKDKAEEIADILNSSDDYVVADATRGN